MSNDIENKFIKARQLFPHTNKITFLNSASYGPFSTAVTEAIEQNLEIRKYAKYDDSHDAFETRMILRKDLASLIGADRSEVGLGMNTSFGLNIAAYGLPLSEGDEVLISDIEFPAGAYTFGGAAKQLGLNLKFVKSKDNCYSIENLEKSITSKTKVVAVSFVQFFNGYKNDLKTIGEICKKNNIYFVVDGIQGMGAEPINVKELNIDIFSSGCQKWMLSPQGCGFFYIKEELRDKLKNPFFGWLSVDWKVTFTDLFRYEIPHFDSSERFELGYYGVLNLLGMKASIDIIKDLEIVNIQKHNHSLIDILSDYIQNSSFYSITSLMEEKHRSSIFTFNCKDVEKLTAYLTENSIFIAQREGSVRVSVHLFNNEDDINGLIKVLEKFASSN